MLCAYHLCQQFTFPQICPFSNFVKCNQVQNTFMLCCYCFALSVGCISSTKLLYSCTQSFLSNDKCGIWIHIHIITRLCSVSQCHGAFQHLSADCFNFTACKCFGSLLSLLLTLIPAAYHSCFFKTALICVLYAVCPTTIDRQCWMVKILQSGNF